MEILVWEQRAYFALSRKTLEIFAALGSTLNDAAGVRSSSPSASEFSSTLSSLVSPAPMGSLFLIFILLRSLFHGQFSPSLISSPVYDHPYLPMGPWIDPHSMLIKNLLFLGIFLWFAPGKEVNAPSTVHHLLQKDNCGLPRDAFPLRPLICWCLFGWGSAHVDAYSAAAAA